MHTIRLTDICTPKQWKPLPQTEMTGSGYPVYGANGLKGYYSRYNHVHPVIAIASRGRGCGTVYLTQPKAYVTANALCLEELHPDILPEYLYYYLKNYDFAPIVTGAALPQITTISLRDVTVRYGSQEQQQHIVNILQQCDSILAKQQKRLLLLQQLKAAHYAALQHRYTTHAGGAFIPLFRIATIVCGKRNAGAATPSGTYPFFTCAKEVQTIDCYDFDDECVLVSGNIDFRVRYFNGKFSAYQRVYIIRPKEPANLSARYLFSYLLNNTQLLESQSIGTSIKYLKKKELQQTPIWVPPFPIQNSIADSMQCTDNAIANTQNAINKILLLARKLMQDAWSR